jgi:RecB family endonuclease NucS
LTTQTAATHHARSAVSDLVNTLRRAMRLLVARCEVHYTGRLTTVLPEAVRLLMFKSDGSVLIHDDAGAKPLNSVRREFRPEI